MPPSTIAYAVLLTLLHPPSQTLGWGASNAERTPQASLTLKGERNLTPGLEVMALPGQSFRKWEDLQARHNAQIAHDRSAWNSLVAHFTYLPPEQLLESVNRTVNRVPYVSDRQSGRSSDYWEAPLEFFRNGGDCEDYAISKYMLLRQLGFDPAEMEIAITKNHAFLIVSSPYGPIILDNRKNRPYKLRYRDIKNIVFTINDSDWSTVVSRNKIT